MSELARKIVELHDALAATALPHGFGGALALAWCTEQPRATNDIDLNVFVDADQIDVVLTALPRAIEPTSEQVAQLRGDGQCRLFWEHTPVDLFLNTTPFHQEVMDRLRTYRFAGRDLPFLCCTDLAVFKAFFDRTKDWADLEAMLAAETFDRERVLGILVTYLGGADPRIERLRTLAPT